MIEETTKLKPRYNDQGVVPCITQDADSGQILMMAWMNETSLQKTLETGEAHYWSRSRQELWHKGAKSGAIQKLINIKIDCDQDCLLMRVHIENKKGTCHTGRETCFYRTINADGSLSHDDVQSESSS